MKIGLTNDDGYDSPILKNFILDLKETGNEIVTLFPAEEQSWCSQRATRFGNLKLQQFDSILNSLNGTPADCASLLVEHFNVKELLISGINMGTNASDAFYFSSGTIGAARQAAFYGVKSLAISWAVTPDVYKKWKEGKTTFEDFEGQNRWVSKCAVIITEFLKDNINWEQIHHISINIPTEKTHVANYTSISQKKYLTLYEKIGENSFRFKFGGLKDVTSEAFDDWSIQSIKKEVSITCFNKDFTVSKNNLGPILELSNLLKLKLS